MLGGEIGIFFKLTEIWSKPILWYKNSELRLHVLFLLLLQQKKTSLVKEKQKGDSLCTLSALVHTAASTYVLQAASFPIIAIAINDGLELLQK